MLIKIYHIKVATAPPGSEVDTHLPLSLMLKFSVLEFSFSTINTFFPVGVLNATFGKLVARLLAIRTEPAGTNRDACAMI